MKEHKQCYDCYSSVDDVKKCVREGHQVLILMRGVPGSGKTHLAKELLSLRQDGIICSTDEYFLDNQGNYKFNIGLLGEYHKKNCNKAREAINNDVTPVIIDNTNIRGEYMKPYILQACKRYYEIYIVEPKTPWSRKAGQCAIHNTHGVTKEAIMEMLDDMDLEQNPSLESLLGKGYKVVLDPPMEGHDDDDQDMNDISLAQTLAPSSIPILFTPPPGFSTPNVTNVDPLFSLHHVPKPLKKTVEVRDMATQATDVIVALSLVGLSDIIDDVVEEDCREHERDVEMPDTKERKTQYVKRETDDEYPTDLDMLVSIYPSEDMSTLYHNYLQYGLIMTIRMNCDVGLMPDHTAEVIAGSFNKEIAKALETGSFEHESIADSAFSDANTSTSNSEQIDEVEERIYEVDIGKDLFKQLEAHFGGSCNDNRSSSTKAFLPEPFLRKLYEAVLHQQLAGCMDTSDVDRDAEYARKLQDSEDYSALPPKNQMNGAQYLQFQQLLRDYPQYNPDTLQTLYASMGFNATETIRCLSDTDHPPKPLPQSAKPFANNVKPATKRHLPPSRNEDTPSYYDSTKKSHKSHYFDKAHRAVIHHIEKANVIKEKKDRIISEAYKCHSGSGLKSLYSVVHRQNAATLAKQERAELIKVRDIIFEANRQSKYLDLHYLTQQDALKMVKERFEQLDRKDGRRGPIRYLTIVTGYGKTSGEREIVKKFITGWLTSKQYKYHFSNKGSIEVTCK